MRIEAAVFDLDGLMIDSERVVMHAWNVAGERLGYGTLGDNLYQTLGMNKKSREQYFLGKYGPDFPFEEFSRENKQAFYEYASRHGIAARKGLFSILKKLKELQIPMAVATSSSRDYALEQLAHHRIRSCFQVLVTGDMVKEAKPSPEIYQKACLLLGCSPEHAVALEDSVNGILSAHGAGMLPLLIPDLVQDTGQIDDLLAGRFEDLEQAGEWIASQIRKTEHT